MTKEYGLTVSHIVDGIDIPETSSMRERRECIEWIADIIDNAQARPHDVDLSRKIMDHCFKVALSLLGKSSL